MSLKWPPKDPDEVLDYKVNWADRLNGDVIATSSFEIVTGGDALEMDSEENTTTTATVWLSGGTLGQVYTLLNRIVTAGDRTMDQTVSIKIKAK